MYRCKADIFYKSGQRGRVEGESMREVETLMEQAGRQARKRGDEILAHAVGIYNPKYVITATRPQAAKSALQLPNAPFVG